MTNPVNHQSVIKDNQNKDNNSKNSIKNRLLNYLSVIIIVFGISLFYILKINIILKWVIVLFSIGISAGVFFFLSPLGMSLHSYLKDTWRELHKVVWPTRRETTQFTWIVVLFVLVLAIFLWLIDSSLSWLFYSLILGR